MRKIFKLFLSYPGSGRSLAQDICDAIVKEMNESFARDLFDLHVAMWDDAEQPVTLPAFGDPTDHIFAKKFPPNQADLFIVCLRDRIGDGTMKEVANRVEHIRNGEPPTLDIFVQLSPPKGITGPLAEHAKKQWETLTRWLGDPFVPESGGERSLGRGPLFYNPVDDHEALIGRVRMRLREALSLVGPGTAHGNVPDFGPFGYSG